MPRINFVTLDGEQMQVSCEIGSSLMEAAVMSDVPGIDADCGGGCSCATCHVYIDAQWRERVGPANDLEKDMLDFQPSHQANSRLSCQISVTEELDGLVVTVAEHD